MQLFAGETVGNYTILEALGQGGYGAVYKAKHNQEDRLVAIKIMLTGGDSQSEQEQRFLHEMNVLSKLSHRHIVRLYDQGIYECDGEKAPWYAMELLTGPSLDMIMTKKMPLYRKIEILEQLTSALAKMHEQGYIHRDVKPQNIRFRSKCTKEGLCQDCSDPFGCKDAVLHDMGLVHDPQKSMTLSSQILGTTAYLSPEQLAGKYDYKQIDVWAVGVILYQWLTGEHPFAGRSRNTIEIMNAIYAQKMIPLPDNVNPCIAKICERALARDPGERHSNAEILRSELETWRAKSQTIYMEMASQEEKANRIDKAIELYEKAFLFHPEETIPARLKTLWEQKLSLPDIHLIPQDKIAEAFQKANREDAEVSVIKEISIQHPDVLPDTYDYCVYVKKKKKTSPATDRQDKIKKESGRQSRSPASARRVSRIIAGILVGILTLWIYSVAFVKTPGQHEMDSISKIKKPELEQSNPKDKQNGDAKNSGQANDGKQGDVNKGDDKKSGQENIDQRLGQPNPKDKQNDDTKSIGQASDGKQGDANKGETKTTNNDKQGPASENKKNNNGQNNIANEDNKNKGLTKGNKQSQKIEKGQEQNQGTQTKTANNEKQDPASENKQNNYDQKTIKITQTKEVPKIPGFKFKETKTYTCGNITQTVWEFEHEKIKKRFVYIPGGTFMMGSNNWYKNEKPVHKVTLSPYLIGKYKVTQAEWLKVMSDGNPSYFKDDRTKPVESVSWQDCLGFCQRTGLELPTEAQWEFACRAGSEKKYCFGDDDSKLDEYAWYSENSNGQTHPVGSKAPNAFGLHDMHGNVLEWCSDWYGVYPNREEKDPVGPTSGDYRCCRGGSWNASRRGMRASRRYRCVPGNNIGFRVVYNLGRAKSQDEYAEEMVENQSKHRTKEPGKKLLSEDQKLQKLHTLYKRLAELESQLNYPTDPTRDIPGEIKRCKEKISDIQKK